MFKLKIATIDNVFYEGYASILNVHTINGHIGVLENHSPFVDIIKASEMTFKDENDEMRKLAVGGGYLFVWRSEVTVFVNSTQFDFQIDIEEARREQKLAEESILSGNLDIIQLAKAKSSLDKSLNRILVASKAENKLIK